jgi:N-acetylglutamate synthase/N-acetylornithine aminotransferase
VVKVVAVVVTATAANVFKGMGGKKENMQLFETFLETIMCKPQQHYL